MDGRQKQQKQQYAGKQARKTQKFEHDENHTIVN